MAVETGKSTIGRRAESKISAPFGFLCRSCKNFVVKGHKLDPWAAAVDRNLHALGFHFAQIFRLVKGRESDPLDADYAGLESRVGAGPGS